MLERVDKKKIFARGRHLGLVVVVVALIVWGCYSPVLTSAADRFQSTYFHEGWSQQVGEETIPLASIQDYIPVEVGQSLVFTCTLPEIDEGQVFLFYSVDKEVLCYVDGELVQNFTMQEGYTQLQTPGSVWNQVDLDPAMSGKTCTLVFHSPLGKYNFLCDIYFIQDEYVDTVRVGVFWQAVVAAVAVCSIMLITASAAIVAQQPQRRRYLLANTQYFLVVLAWLLAELNAYDLIFARPIISYLLGEAFRRMIPLALLYLAKNSTAQYWHPKLLEGVWLLAWWNLIVAMVLQFVFGVSFLQTELLHNLTGAITDIALLAMVAEKLVRFKKMHYEEYLVLALPILIVCGGVDNAILSFDSVYYPFLGVWTAVGGVAFSVVTLVLLTYINDRVAQEKAEIQKTCHALENATLVKQLEAHFIFNALNTISAYCKTDPEEADRSVVAFAGYLRAYLHLIDQRDAIPLHKELELVRQYLIIQQMRFGTTVQFAFHVDYSQVDVPPFSLYTLVENAVVHGINTKEDGGTVTISSKQVGEYIQLVVADDGVGFDTSLPMKDTSVGLSNTRKRLELMKNATLTVDSQVGVGTTAVICIPL